MDRKRRVFGRNLAEVWDGRGIHSLGGMVLWRTGHGWDHLMKNPGERVEVGRRQSGYRSDKPDSAGKLE